MATYPVKNKETGETKDVVMSIHDWDQWREGQSRMGKDTILLKMHHLLVKLGEWKDKLRKKNPGWNDVLSRVKKMPGSSINKI